MRERLEKHRRSEPCASCHKMMDPIGMAMENFDAIGVWRANDSGFRVDPSGQMLRRNKAGWSGQPPERHPEPHRNPLSEALPKTCWHTVSAGCSIIRICLSSARSSGRRQRTTIVFRRSFWVS